ncbi:helix-turn-helix transcriptional regulator [Jatrophihabitans sp.]|uniref:helix-turn-helix transcriptional regulator n=1 Tax=Jatrophihabitans sp. TaxID=1932789 RepID=UPI002B67E39B|nr:PAS domain S-box protein [Jatrophihabitans sp.]
MVRHAAASQWVSRPVGPMTRTVPYGASFDGAPATTIAVVGTNTSGVVTLWSSGAAAMFDWTEEEAIGRPIAELAEWGLSRKDVTEFLFIGTSGLWVHEHEVTTRTGKRMRLKTTASLVAGADGVEEILASSTRIELPEGRARLSMTERPFRALLERGSDLVVICDRNLVIGYAGPSLWRMFGCLPRQVIGHSGWDYVHPQDLAVVRRDWEGAVSGAGEYRRLELRIRNGEGNWRWIEVRISNLVADVSIGAMVLNIRDITEQHEIAEALASSEHLLQTIVDASSEGVCIVDPDGSLVLANYRMAEMLAVNHTRLLTGQIFDFFDEETTQMLRQRLRQRALGVRELYEFSFRRLDGQHRWLRVSGAPWYDQNGRYLGAIGMVTDVTDLKQREELSHSGSNFTMLPGRIEGPGGYLLPRLLDRMPAELMPPSQSSRSLPGLDRLSRREIEVVRMLLHGDRVPVIARQLFISQSTVRNHLSSVFRKLRVNSQQELIVLLRERDSPDR